MEIKDQQQEEVIVNQFEVEELEERLENKWGSRCPNGGTWSEAKGKCIVEIDF